MLHPHSAGKNPGVLTPKPPLYLRTPQSREKHEAAIQSSRDGDTAERGPNISASSTMDSVTPSGGGAPSDFLQTLLN